MAFLVVMNFDIRDHEIFAEYAQGAGRTMPPDVKVLVFDDARYDLEGKSHERLVILEFESEEEALSWYRSKEYQTLAELRRASTDGWVRGAPKFQPKRS